MIFYNDQAKSRATIAGWRRTNTEFHGLSPDFVTLIDVDTMVAACERAGFEIIKSEYIARPDYPPHLQNDGRENSGVVVRKN